MNIFIRNLLDSASHTLVTDSPMSLKGKVLAAYIAKRTSQGAAPRELREQIDELDEIIQVVHGEQAHENARRAIGEILKNFDSDSWVLTTLESDQSTNAQYLKQHLTKGDTYEVHNYDSNN
jgi:hypothetical protein